MNPRLVNCLLGSAVIAVAAGILVAFSGGGWLMGLLTYSFVGSATLLAATVLTLPGEPRRPRPAKPLPPPSASSQATRAVA